MLGQHRLGYASVVDKPKAQCLTNNRVYFSLRIPIPHGSVEASAPLGDPGAQALECVVAGRSQLKGVSTRQLVDQRLPHGSASEQEAGTCEGCSGMFAPQIMSGGDGK